MIPRLTAEIVAEEEPPDRMQHAARHFQHVLHDFLDWRVRDGHVHGSNGDHEVQSGDDVAGILYKFIEVGEVVSVLDVCVV